MTPNAFGMPADVSLVGLTLRVRDLDAEVAPYRDVFGLEIDAGGGTPTLRLPGADWALTLSEDTGAPPRPQPSIGLYHFALLLPNRPALGAILRRLGEAGWALDGAAHHGVSEALYLRDPERNGIELYHDLPRDRWPRDDGEVVMGADPLDLDEIADAASAPGPLDPETRFGHIHLHVPNLEEAESFYAGTLGLRVTQRGYPGALFCAAGDYHHHVGLNIWARGRQAPSGATGLVSYRWRVPADTLAELAERLEERGVEHDRRDGLIRLVDPSDTVVEITA